MVVARGLDPSAAPLPSLRGLLLLLLLAATVFLGTVLTLLPTSPVSPACGLGDPLTVTVCTTTSPSLSE